MAYELSYSGNVLPKDITQQLINYAVNDLNVPPSYLITKLHYEGLWGGSSVARENNNWGGMTWVSSWSNPHNRDSGVTVTRGTARPSNEGGYYIKYETVQDFLIDWSYLIRRGGIYNVADSSTFNNAVKGMFIYGGASADYATMNVEGSQLRYELYLEGMLARRTGINTANENKLDILDSEKPTDPVDPPDPDPEPPEIVIDVEKIKKLLTKDLFKNGNSGYYQNGYLIIQKQLDNTYKVKLSKKMIEELGKGTVILPPDPDPDPDPTIEKPIVPVKKGTPITDPFGWRINPVTGASELHNGTDYGGQNNDPIYATMSGTVEMVGYNEFRGNWLMIKHSTDNKYSKYLHMNATNYAIGETIKQGDVLGYMGTTGQSTGVHLHFTITTTPEGTLDGGQYIDPEIYLKG